MYDDGQVFGDGKELNIKRLNEHLKFIDLAINKLNVVISYELDNHMMKDETISDAVIVEAKYTMNHIQNKLNIMLNKCVSSKKKRFNKKNTDQEFVNCNNTKKLLIDPNNSTIEDEKISASSINYPKLNKTIITCAVHGETYNGLVKRCAKCEIEILKLQKIATDNKYKFIGVCSSGVVICAIFECLYGHKFKSTVNNAICLRCKELNNEFKRIAEDCKKTMKQNIDEQKKMFENAKKLHELATTKLTAEICKKIINSQSELYNYLIALTKNRSPFDILLIPHELRKQNRTKLKEICKKNYKLIVKQIHPDKCKYSNCNNLFNIVNTAYKQIMTPSEL